MDESYHDPFFLVPQLFAGSKFVMFETPIYHMIPYASKLFDVCLERPLYHGAVSIFARGAY